MAAGPTSTASSRRVRHSSPPAYCPEPGLFDPTYLTVAAGAIAPGAGNIGTLNIKGDVILASASGLLIDVAHGAGDQLKIAGDADNAGVLLLNGGSLVFNPFPAGPVARDGDKFPIAAATAVNGTLGSAGASSGCSGAGDHVHANACVRHVAGR